MSQHKLVLEHEIAATAADVWSAIIDHEGMARWLPARVTLVAHKQGGGPGTVRRIRAGGVVVIDEEVVYADPPEGAKAGRLVYRIVRGAPIDFHRGEMLVESLGDRRSRITWDILIASKVRGVARATVAVLRPALRDGLRKLGAILS